MGGFEEQLLEHDSCQFNTFTYPASPEVEYKGLFIIVHGWTEHILMYKDVAKALSSLGYSCFAFDLREHGKTRGNYTDNTCFTRDLDFMVKYNLAQDKRRKVNLLGHSMGGAVVLEYLHSGKYRSRISSVIACGPYIELHESSAPSPLLVTFVSFIAYLFPNLKYRETKSISSYTSVTTNVEKQKEMLHDKLCVPSSTLRLMSGMYNRGQSLLNSASTFSSKAKLLILQTERDTIVSAKSSKKFFDALPLDNKKMVFFEQAGHALLLEVESTVREVYAIIREFLTNT